MPLDYEPFSVRWRDDPYPAYRELRDRAPLHFAPESDCFCLSRHEDVLFALNHPELFSSRAMFTVIFNGGFEGPPPLTWPMLKFLVRFALATRSNPLGFQKARNLIASDAPAHGELRAIVNRGFTPRRIQAWEPRIREIAAARIAPLAAGRPFDLVGDFAIPLPVTIIAEMLGVESERFEDFKRWSDAVIEGATGSKRGFPPHPETLQAFVELDRYLARRIRLRRRRPADDLVSAILAEAPGGERLSSLELMQFLSLLLVAGNETTTNLIGNTVSALLDHPRELARVAFDPRLVPALVEEGLRYDSPVQIVFRTATREIERHGVRVPQGAIVALLLGSANRDERRFAHPDRFDVGRDARGHLGFGFGQHFCLGASLARLEARVAFEALVPELPRLERASPERTRLDSFLVRGLRHLELRRAA
jgi:cytochrome P450